MTLEEIRKQAPQGATHYAKTESGVIIYLKKQGRVINFMDNITSERFGVIRAL